MSYTYIYIYIYIYIHTHTYTHSRCIYIHTHTVKIQVIERQTLLVEERSRCATLATEKEEALKERSSLQQRLEVLNTRIEQLEGLLNQVGFCVCLYVCVCYLNVCMYYMCVYVCTYVYVYI